MLTQESLIVILYSLPVYQLLFYTVQLITFKRSNPSRRYLGILLMTMTAFLVINAIYHLGYDHLMKGFYFFFVPVLLSVPPVFYLYTLSIAKENHDVDSRTRFILFLPPIIVLFLNFIIYRSLTGAEKLVFLQNGFEEAGTESVTSAVLMHWIALAGLLFVQIILAITGTYRVFRKEAELMHKQPGHLAYLQLRWVLVVSVCVIGFIIAGSAFNLIGTVDSLEGAVIFNVLMLICGGLTGFYGMKQDSLLTQVSKVRSGETFANDLSEPPGKETDQDIRDDNSQEYMPEEEARQIIKKLEELMEKEKPYLNPRFSMSDLSEKMNLSRRKVTYVINEVMQKNFYGVINDYRIEEALTLLKDESSKDYKMDAIAEMVGFQSKSSFYACFRKYTGLTPTEYRMTGGQSSR